MLIPRFFLLAITTISIVSCQLVTHRQDPVIRSNNARLEAQRIKEEDQKKERARQQQLHEEARRAADAAFARQIESIRSGNAKVQTAREAEVIHNAIVGENILFEPLLSGGNGKYYSLIGWITQNEGNVYLSWWPDMDRDLPAVGFVVNNPKLMGEIRFRQQVRVIAKYTANRKIRLTNGGVATVPVFDGGYIFPLD